MKVFNIKGIIIIIIVFLVIHFTTGLVISPIVGKFIVDKINDNTDAKIRVDKVYVWPFTLSFSMKNLKVFDPKNEQERIIKVGSMGARLSPMGFLKKRIVLSKLSVDDAEITLKREPDGSFNIEDIARPKDTSSQPSGGSLWDRFKGKGDWFQRVWEIIKEKFSKKSVEKKKEERKQAKQVEKTVVQLPKGRKVEFKTASDDYLFEIKNVAVNNARITMQADKQQIELEKTDIKFKNLAFDPKKGMSFKTADIKGSLKNEGSSAGSFSIASKTAFKRDQQTADFDIVLKNIDMAAVSFIYKDSAPVKVEKGILNLNSDTGLIDNNIDSKNVLSLKDQNIQPKSKGSIGIVPIPMICEAINKMPEFKIKFNITGPVEDPKFTGFEQSLLEAVKPYLADIKEKIKKEGEGILKDFLGKFKKE